MAGLRVFIGVQYYIEQAFSCYPENNVAVESLQEVAGAMVTADTCSQRWGANFTDDIVCFTSGSSGPCNVSCSGENRICKFVSPLVFC